MKLILIIMYNFINIDFIMFNYKVEIILHKLH